MMKQKVLLLHISDGVWREAWTPAVVADSDVCHHSLITRRNVSSRVHIFSHPLKLSILSTYLKSRAQFKTLCLI